MIKPSVSNHEQCLITEETGWNDTTEVTQHSREDDDIFFYSYVHIVLYNSVYTFITFEINMLRIQNAS